jgi:parallel beta-helix repeat protein
LSNNDLSYNGLAIWSADSNNLLIFNSAKNNNQGIYITNGQNNNLTKNIISDNSGNGFEIWRLSNCLFHENLINNNSYGVYAFFSGQNVITNNWINNNTNYGMFFAGTPSGNFINNNYFNNSNNAYTSEINSWNTTKKLGPNIVGNPYIGGNVWAKPDGTGLSQTQTDENADGISIFGYSITPDNIDYLPLLLPQGKPIGHFITNVTSGSEPLAVAFNDTSPNLPASWNWSFTNVTGNNTQVWFSTEQNTVHTFGVGNYSIALNASNSAGYNLSTQVTFINVTATPIFPVANFTANVTIGIAPLAVKFTDASMSTGISAWKWDFNNDGMVDSTIQSPEYTYSNAGMYTVNLTVTGTAGSDSEVKTNYIIVIVPTIDTNTALTTIAMVIQRPPIPVANFTFVLNLIMHHHH